jgi:hypothetical protein
MQICILKNPSGAAGFFALLPPGGSKCHLRMTIKKPVPDRNGFSKTPLLAPISAATISAGKCETCFGFVIRSFHVKKSVSSPQGHDFAIWQSRGTRSVTGKPIGVHRMRTFWNERATRSPRFVPQHARQ